MVVAGMKDNTHKQQPWARVFIGCGQRSDEEKELGSRCKKHFEGRGFSVYLAEEHQSLEALTENIFHHLRNSEYAVFIDCRRDELSPGKFRGSMFVNQELAIAAFLPIEESRVFHQEGVIEGVIIEGVAKYLIAKPIHFSSRQQFLGKLRRQTKDWHNDWRNELSLKFLRKVPGVRWLPNNTVRDWYHLQVSNKHYSKYARNCVGYVMEINNLDTGVIIKPPNFELIWAGTGLFERHILPKRAIDLDAFFIVQGKQEIEFHCRLSTSSEYTMPRLSKGNYLLTYLIVSENFEQVTKTFKLEFGGDYMQIKFGEEVA